MKIPSIKSGVVGAATKVGSLAKKGFTATKALADDTILITKFAPKQTAVIAGATVAATALVATAVKLIKSGVEKAKLNKQIEKAQDKSAELKEEMAELEELEELEEEMESSDDE